MRKGHIVIIAGPSGVGKGTVCKLLLQRNEQMQFSVSATTREPRPNEVDGVHYYFVDKARFEQMIAQNELLEYAPYVDNYYGTPAAPVDAALAEGKDVLLEIDIKGALQVKKARPDAILIFMVAPSLAELENRLRGRGDTSPEKIVKRLATAREEYKAAPQCDYIVVNDEVENAYHEINSILTAHDCQTQFRMDYLKEEN